MTDFKKWKEFRWKVSSNQPNQCHGWVINYALILTLLKNSFEIHANALLTIWRIYSKYFKVTIIPEDADLALLKGSVQFGFNPTVIVQRIIRSTFGVSTNMQFSPRTDPEDKQIIIHMMYWRDRFGKYVARGESVN